MSLDLKSPESVSPEISPTGGLPADFFENPGAAPNAPSPLRRSIDKPVANGPRSRSSMLPVVLTVILGNIILFLGGALAGWAFAKKDPQPQPSAAQVIVSPASAEVARAVESKASKDEVGGLKGEIGVLESQIKKLKDEVTALSHESTRLKERVEAPREPVASPPVVDVKGLESRLDRLADATRRLAALPTDMHTLGEKVGALDRRIEGFRSELSALPGQLKKAVAPPPPAVAPKPEKDLAKVSAEAREKGLALFSEGKFLEARDAFLKQTVEVPDDARNWYFAALANGFGTGSWDGETMRLVTRGVEREAAGTPPRAEIDAAFVTLNQPQGKAWLKGWRDRAVAR